jgi:hypothetical protein
MNADGPIQDNEQETIINFVVHSNGFYLDCSHSSDSCFTNPATLFSVIIGTLLVPILVFYVVSRKIKE